MVEYFSTLWCAEVWCRKEGRHIQQVLMGGTVVGVNCGVTEQVQCATLRWYGHVTIINKDDFLMSVWEQDWRRGVRWRPLVKWIKGVNEYKRGWASRGWNVQSRYAWTRRSENASGVATPLVEVHMRGLGTGDIGRLINVKFVLCTIMNCTFYSRPNCAYTVPAFWGYII